MARRCRQVLEYYCARALMEALARLPLPLAVWLGRRLGGIWRHLDRRRRRTVEIQASEVLGLSPGDARRFAKRNFGNHGATLAEFSRLTRLTRDDFSRYVDFAGFDILCRRLLDKGRGVVFVTAHFGNWEWFNSLASSLGVSGGSIARPLDNQRLNAFVKGIRERNGLSIFDKQGAMRQALRTLRDNRVVGVLLDQDAGGRGLMSPFLGRPASTLTVPVELAMRSGAPMVAAALRRNDGPGRRFVVRFNPSPHQPDPGADPELEVDRVVHALNRDLSALILEAPEQWFWIHRRWKSAGRR